jgi:hypothetical protein
MKGNSIAWLFIVGCVLLGLILFWASGCSSVPVPPLPPGAVTLLSSVAEIQIAPAPAVNVTLTYTWNCSTAGYYYTGLRGSDVLVGPVTNWPIVFEAPALLSNSFTMTTNSPSFFVIAFNTNL